MSAAVPSHPTAFPTRARSSRSAGGEGRIFGTLIAALIIAVMRNGMNLTNVEPNLQNVVLGLVILGAVLVDRARIRRGNRRK